MALSALAFGLQAWWRQRAGDLNGPLIVQLTYLPLVKFQVDCRAKPVV
jgi:hypothetical protein